MTDCYCLHAWYQLRHCCRQDQVDCCNQAKVNHILPHLLSVAFSLATSVRGIHPGHQGGLHCCDKSGNVTDACRDAARHGSAAVADVYFCLKGRKNMHSLSACTTRQAGIIEMSQRGFHQVVTVGKLTQNCSPSPQIPKRLLLEDRHSRVVTCHLRVIATSFSPQG